MNEIAKAFRANTLASAKVILESETGEEFAIELLDLLLDVVWEKEEILQVIEETFENEEDTENPGYSEYRQWCHERCILPVSEREWLERADMNANDDEHMRDYKRSVL